MSEEALLRYRKAGVRKPSRGPPGSQPTTAKESFESRMAILEAGYYDHVKEAVLTAVGRALSPSEVLQL